MTWLLRKRNPENELDVLTKGLQAALGKRLKSVIVFGSFVRQEFDAKRSNLNVLLVSDLSFDALLSMGPAVRKWIRQGNVPPVVVVPNEIDDFARDFPVEFLDMLQHHRVLFGENVLDGLHLNKKHLESQIEHDLALIQLKLRQVLADSQGESQKMRRALERSVSSVGVLIKATWLLTEENEAQPDKMQAVEKLGAKWGIDVAVLKDVVALRQGTLPDSMKVLVERYLSLIQAVLERLRRS